MHGGDDVADPNLTPLLDVVLQLIMFFMITVNFVRTDQINEEVTLPVAQAAVPMDQAAEDWIFLNMNKEGKLVGSAEDLTTPGKLKAHLQREKEALQRQYTIRGKKGEVKVVVVLRAHKDARYGQIWDILKSCTDAGYKRWQLRVLTKPA